MNETSQIEQLLNSHEKELLTIYETNLTKMMSDVELLKSQGQLVPTRMMHGMRDQQQEINRIYIKHNLPPKYDVADIQLSEQQMKLSSHEQELLKIHLLNLEHLQNEGNRLKENGTNNTITETLIAETKNAIIGIENSQH